MRSLRKDEIKKKLKDIDESISLVKANLPKRFGFFLELGLLKDGIYKKIEFAIESVIDICNIINTDLSFGVPSNDEDIIRNLEFNKILSKGLISKIKEMKGFRNALVHKYGKIDDRLAFLALQKNLDDFDFFKKEILAFVG